MKATKTLALSICLMMVLMLVSCAPHAVSPEVEPSASEPVSEVTAEPTAEPTPTAKPTPTVAPTATIVPTPTPEPQDGERYDIKRERVRCTIDATALDMKETWKVNSPTESPDPAWIVESVEGDTVTYSKTDCDHVRRKEVHVPCSVNPDREDTVNYYTTTVETAQTLDYLNTCTLVSEEDGLVTYESEAKCPDAHKKIQLVEDIPCTKNPQKTDAKYTFKVHNSLEGDPLDYIVLENNRYGFLSNNRADYEFQGMDGDWAVYTYIQCASTH